MTDGFTPLGLPTGTTAGTVAAGDHTHAGSAIDSGTVAYARLPTGTASSTVAIGDHTHAATANNPSIPADRGWLAWNMRVIDVVAGTALPTAGLLHLVRIRRVPVATINSIVLYIATAGNTLTTGQCFAALYASNGTWLRSTADQSVAWATNGVKTMALTSSYSNTTLQDFYVGMWFNGTTGPSPMRSTTQNATNLNTGLTAGNFEWATADTSITTTTPNPFGAQTAGSAPYWAAVA